jgi:hypothetical protein
MGKLNIKQERRDALRELTKQMNKYATERTFLRSTFKKQYMHQLCYFLEQENFFTAQILANQLRKDAQFCYAYFTNSTAKRLVDDCCMVLTVHNAEAEGAPVNYNNVTEHSFPFSSQTTFFRHYIG